MVMGYGITHTMVMVYGLGPLTCKKGEGMVIHSSDNFFPFVSSRLGTSWKIFVRLFNSKR